MTKDQISLLFELLPDENAFTEGAKVATNSKRVLNRRILRLVCLDDPAFLYKFMRTFIEKNRPLPKDPTKIIPPVVRRAYDVLKGKGGDPEMEDAIALSDPEFQTQSAVLKALLLCVSEPADSGRDFMSESIPANDHQKKESIPFQEIAQHVRVSAQTVQDYHDLFFNVRGRRHEAAFVAKLVYPNGIGETRNENFRRHGPLHRKLLIASLEKGMDAVLFLAGLTPDDHSEMSESEAARQLRGKILRAANDEMDYGDASSPIVAHAAKLAIAHDASESATSDAECGLTAVGRYYPILETLKKMAKPSIDKMLELQQASAQESSSQITAYSPDEVAP